MTLYAKVSGYLKTLRVDLGDWVRAGQALAEIDIPEMTSSLEEKRAGLLKAKAALEQSRATVEQGRKQLQKSWAGRIGDPDAAWALIAQCVGALVLARCVESERTRKDILASSRRFIGETHALNSAPAARRKHSAQ